MANKLEDLYKAAQALVARKDEFLKYPEEFKLVLDELRKAAKDEDDEDQSDEDFGDGYSVDDPNGDGEDDEAAKWLKDQKSGGFFSPNQLDSIKNAKTLSDAKAQAKAAVEEHPRARQKNIQEALHHIESAKTPKDLHNRLSHNSMGQAITGSTRSLEDQYDKKFSKDWEPRSDYSDKEKAAIKQHMDNGYTHREAERMAGAHKGPMDFASAMKSGITPSMMSDKMMGDLKPLAKLWLEEADKKEKLSANPEVNPVKAAAGKMTQAHENQNADYSKAYNEFLGSDKLKDLKGRDRHQAIQKWKSEWKNANPEHEAGHQSVSETQQAFKENKGAAKQSLQDKIAHITSGGQSMPADMSANEAMQHLGGGKTEEGYQGQIVSDPSASFAARNPKLLAALKPEQQERLKAVDSAAKSLGKVRIRKGGAQ